LIRHQTILTNLFSGQNLVICNHNDHDLNPPAAILIKVNISLTFW